MAKTIKFNLICDGNPVRTIEELQNNFSIQDVLELYNNKQLHRWLKVRGYPQFEDVTDITASDPMEIIKELIRIFDIETDKQEIEKDIYILNYLERRKERYAVYKQENYNIERIINDYESGYDALVRDILRHPDDVAFIKAKIHAIIANYTWILKRDHRALFYMLAERSPLAIMCLLMNKQCRNYYLPVAVAGEDGKKSFDIDKDFDKRQMYEKIKKMITDKRILNSLGENLITESSVSTGIWTQLQPGGRKFMIVSMDKGDYVCPAYEGGDGLSVQDIRDKFVIINGIDYKSSSAKHCLRYMKV